MALSPQTVTVLQGAASPPATPAPKLLASTGVGT